MLNRTTVRTVATLVAALCVTTMFAGSAAAIDLGAVSVDDGDDAAVDIDTALDTEASQSGGGGSGGVSVQSDQGGAEGSGAVGADAENQSVTVAAAGEAGPAGDEQGGSVECTFDQESVQNPQEACDYQLPGGDGSPLPDDRLPELPGDELPQLPGDGLPVDPGAGVPLDGLQAS